MKEKDNISKLFERLEGEFDIETPDLNHENRFLRKLKQQQENPIADVSKPVRFPWWKHMAAACILLLSLGIFIGSNLGTETEDTQQITFSPEVEKSQIHLASLIEKELEKVKAAEDEDTKEIVQDALQQLKRLEIEYNELKNELISYGEDKRILQAMITNFQLRIQLLEEVLIQIEEIKIFKNENTII